MLLAIECSGRVASATWIDPDGESLEFSTPTGTGSASELAVVIERIFNAKSKEKLQAIAVTTGPGSFTGLRVGVATAKALAYGLRIPVVAIDTLEAMSLSAIIPEQVQHIWTVLDAYRGELFVAQWLRNESASSLSEPRPTASLYSTRIIKVQEWEEIVLRQIGEARESVTTFTGVLERLAFVGPGLKRSCLLDKWRAAFDLSPNRPTNGCINEPNPKPIHESETTRPLWLPEVLPTSKEVAAIGYRKWRAGETLDAFALMPVYLRASAAEEKVRKSPEAR